MPRSLPPTCETGPAGEQSCQVSKERLRQTRTMNKRRLHGICRQWIDTLRHPSGSSLIYAVTPLSMPTRGLLVTVALFHFRL